jgi:hypothetical protein
MTSTLDNMRKRLNQVISDASEELDAERLRHEQQLALALESLSQDRACQSAYNDGRSDERSRCLALIDDRLLALKKADMQTTATEALRSAVEGK